MKTDFHTRDEDALTDARVGDVIVLDGKRVRVTKKTNYNAAVVPYTWADAFADWLKAKLGK